MFDGPEARDGEQVFVARRVAPPSVVRYDGHELGAPADETAVKIAVKPFVADCRAGLYTVVFERLSVRPFADLPQRPAEVDHKEFQYVEDPRRGVFDADHQPPFVVDLRAACGIEAHARVENVVVIPEAVLAGRFGLCPGRVAADGIGSGDKQRAGMAAAERIGQFLPESARFARRVEIAQFGFQVVARDGGFGQQDELCAGRNLCQEVDDIALLPLGVAVEFVVAVDVGLDDAHRDRSFVGLFPASPDGQRYGCGQRDGAGRCNPPPCGARPESLENQDIGEQHPQRAAEDARIFVPLHGPDFV